MKVCIDFNQADRDFSTLCDLCNAEDNNRHILSYRNALRGYDVRKQ